MKYFTQRKKFQGETSVKERAPGLPDDESGLVTRAAWMHYVGGMTQGEVARRLNLNSAKTHRLIARASREGLVRVFVDGDVADCVRLEEALRARYGLDMVQVAPDLGETDLPLRALGFAGASYLRGLLERPQTRIIGVGHGRTLASVVHRLPRTASAHVKFVSLLGGLTRKFSASPFDVIHLLAERTGAEAYLMPVPLYANTAADRSVLVGQLGVVTVLGLARQADLLIVGIGEARPSGSLVQSGMVREDEVVELERTGVVSEVLGHFLDAQGRAVETELSARSISFPFKDLAHKNVVAIAGGESKVVAIRAALEGGFLKGLITDEATATALVGDGPGAGLGNKNGAKRR